MIYIPVAFCGLRFAIALNTSDSVRWIASNELAGGLDSSSLDTWKSFLVNIEKKYCSASLVMVGIDYIGIQNSKWSRGGRVWHFENCLMYWYSYLWIVIHCKVVYETLLIIRLSYSFLTCILKGILGITN